MKTTPLKEIDYLVAWLLFFICATVGGAIAGFLGGAIVGAILGAVGVRQDHIRVAGSLVGFILALPVSYLCFRLIVGKFIVSKLEGEATAPPQPAQSCAPPTQ